MSRMEVLLAERLREVTLDELQLELLLLRQIGPVCVTVLLDGLAPLLGHLVQQGDQLGLLQLAAFVHLTLLYGGEDQANGLEPLFLLGTHGGLHVRRDALLQRSGLAHRLPNQ